MAFTWPGGDRKEPLDIETIPEKVEKLIDKLRDGDQEDDN